ncbi:hypothetical protein BLNAU_1952 [Blattamonas nauphoetae]|uniref:Uncharacterized protein n=1 Tax=Blattamonas nauphoetae TaxID=2049346 RepID=A0ABQ9YH79_9EUKA|nr:hypothetical protein BLNAU_1952 [Blattamonas nauphoetae]
MPHHIFLAIPLIASLLRLTYTAAEVPDASLLSLKQILDEMTETRSSNVESRNEPILLHGQYHVLEYALRSLNISIIGAQSASIVSSRTEDNQALSNSNTSSMLIRIIVVGIKLRNWCCFKHKSVFINVDTRGQLDVGSCGHPSELETRDYSSTFWNDANKSQVSGD